MATNYLKCSHFFVIVPNASGLEFLCSDHSCDKAVFNSDMEVQFTSGPVLGSVIFRPNRLG